MRKPIAITSTFDAGDGNYQPHLALHILCDDGTIWMRCTSPHGSYSWTLMPDVPQDVPAPATGAVMQLHDETMTALQAWKESPNA